LALVEARFPVYAVRGRPAKVGSWGRDRDGVDLVEVVHAGPPRLTVTTERHVLHGAAWLARRALAGLGEEPGEWPDLSQPALAIWLNAQERERRRLAATADVLPRQMSIDGAPARFEIATAEIGWAGVRRHGDLLITVAARECAPAEIELDPLVS
jgi:hypothetical protein